MKDNLDYVQTLLNMIIGVCLVYLAFNNAPLFIAMVVFQLMLMGIVIWRSNREVQDGNTEQ